MADAPGQQPGASKVTPYMRSSTPESTGAIRTPQLGKVPDPKGIVMTTIRRGALPTDHFTIISNAWLRDPELTWAARGLLAWLASHADSYEITLDVIVAAGPSGRDAAITMIDALEERGYLRRERGYLPGGGSTVDYVLADPDVGKSDVPNFGKPDPRPDQPKGSVSAGQPDYGKPEAPSTSLEDQKKTKTPSVSMRATRVPEDFQPTDEMRAWFVREQLGQVIDGSREHEQFMDYWRATPGARGRKLDWPATWRRWMRTAADRATQAGVRRPGTGLDTTSGIPYRSTTDERVSQGMALAAKYRKLEEEGKL